jgi:hypothetical protein
MDALNEAAQQRNLYSIGSTVSRRVAAAAATAVRPYSSSRHYWSSVRPIVLLFCLSAVRKICACYVSKTLGSSLKSE